ncbi:MAG: site-2 protease family protein [Clostridiales bacterium]|nr:site-2 protease family protein [Clostridiales bacterium]
MRIFGRLESYIDLLTSDPIGFLLFVLYTAAAILPALILHECAHGYVAYRCGDPTAKMLGRLTLNPAKHLDPIGTICMVLLGFGWAKPVPVNPRNFRNYRRDDILVSIAGIVTNFCLFLVSCALVVVLNSIIWEPDVMQSYGGPLMYNFAGTTFLSRDFVSLNAEFMRAPWLMYFIWYFSLSAGINLSLAFFNLLPIPPLDGFHLLDNILLRNRIQINQQFHDIARFVLMVLCLSGLLGNLLGSVTGAVEKGISYLFMLMMGQV